MARNTFISYKYSETKDLRDKIIKSLGSDAKYYRGENSDTPCKDHLEESTIKSDLKDMLYHTSVLIVILSPEMLKSDWIEWEIKYALKSIKRGDKNSKPNGVIAIVANIRGGDSWFTHYNNKICCGKTWNHKMELVPDIIRKNRNNALKRQVVCTTCGATHYLSDSYISIVSENEFLSNPNKYIENAFTKKEKLDEYEIRIME